MKLIFVCMLFIHASLLQAQQKISWLNAQELEAAYAEEKKGVLIFVYTEWCKICKMQEANMQGDSLLIQSLKKEFYFFKINAESKESIHFFGREYGYDASLGYHELAVYFGMHDSKLEFPSTIILDKNLKPFFARYALVSNQQFKSLLE